MNRQQMMFFALTMVGVFSSSPMAAQAFTIPQSVYSAWQTRSRSFDGLSRTAMTSQTHAFEVRTLHSTLVKSFSLLGAAVTYAKSKKDAAVVDSLSGAMLYTTIHNLYKVQVEQVQGSAPSSLNNTYYPSFSDALATVQQIPNASIMSRLTGTVVWSNAANYWVIMQGSTVPTATYQSLSDAMTAAQGQKNATIESPETQTTVWQANYQVFVGGVFTKSFNTLSDAKAYATNSQNAEVIAMATGKDVWDNIARYDVYQNGALIQQFSQESDALSFAKTLSNVTVVQISSQATVYTNVPQYLVEVGAKVMQSFTTLPPAIAYAKTQSGAVVIQISNNQIVWSGATGTYGVYRYLQLVRSFSTLVAAQAYAKTLDHVQIINTFTQQVLYSNYPTFVKTPYGDTLTVQNGLIVDNWGKLSITWAPAPPFMTSGNTYVSPDYNHWYEVQSGGDKYVGSWENPYQTLNLETSSTMTASQINQFIATHAVSTSVLQGTGKYFIEAQDAYGVNAEYLVAHAIIESAWGTSYFATNRDNLFGYEAYTTNPNAAATFRSIEYDINFQAWFVRNSYLNQTGSFYNGPNLDGMNVDYATDPYWASSIGRIMSEIATYSPSLAAQPLLSEQAQRPFFAYPPGATGQAVTTLSVYAAPADAQGTAPKVIGSIAKGTIFSTLGDSPGWDKVKLTNGVVGFVDWNNVSLQNMVEVTGIVGGSVLNLRSSQVATTTANVVDTVTNGTYLVVLKSPGNGWDYVVDGAGKQGWVASQYVQVIH